MKPTHTTARLLIALLAIWIAIPSFLHAAPPATTAFSELSANSSESNLQATSNNSSISGKVTGLDGTTPLAGINVTVYLSDASGRYWYYASSAQTDANGNYSVRKLAAGTYRLEFSKWNGNYIREFYANAADLNSATDIIVPAETTVTDINASLTSLSLISGKITHPDGTTPLADIKATAYRWNEGGGFWHKVSSAQTDLNGNYSIGSLPAATYRVRFSDSKHNFSPEVYPNAKALASGKDIVVPTETTVTSIDASVANFSSISGKVTQPDGITPLLFAQVTAYRWNLGGIDPTQAFSALTDQNGNYNIRSLTAGTYRVKFRDGQGIYVPEVYANAIDLTSGTDIVVSNETTITGINASLSNFSRISGKVTGADGTTPLGAYVAVYSKDADGMNWKMVSSKNTDGSGNYNIDGLTPGTYRLRFKDWNSIYSPRVYPDTTDIVLGTDIIVPLETTITDINVSLVSYSSISGKVTDPEGTTQLAGISVTVYRWNVERENWDRISSTETNGSGDYSFGKLAAGTYRVDFLDPNKNYVNVTDQVSGAGIVVPAATTVTGINTSLTNASRISGTVTASTGTTPLQRIFAISYRWDIERKYWVRYSSAQIDGSGNYNIGGLVAGTYRVEFIDGNGVYGTEFYSNATDLDSGADIVVPTETTVTGINASLTNASRISGKVTGPDGITPLRWTRVTAYRLIEGGRFSSTSSWAETDESGNYSIGGLSAGSYYV